MLTRELYEDFEVECIYIEYEYILLFSSFLSNFCYLKIPAPISRTSCTLGWADFCLFYEFRLWKPASPWTHGLWQKRPILHPLKVCLWQNLSLGWKIKKKCLIITTFYILYIFVLITHNFVQAKILFVISPLLL